ncbi:Uncharacterized protein TCM_026849 [Theobroma cacao]|uniref:Uncharacterized protein n=1 Tax=Theobroma cacao TaxID=3641 RepID=A0A061F4F4_THECC|nr:Uncharacterized protein TCM_026849 [Theobroma cacao]
MRGGRLVDVKVERAWRWSSDFGKLMGWVEGEDKHWKDFFNVSVKRNKERKRCLSSLLHPSHPFPTFPPSPQVL